jgi:hypothetical protein
VGARKTALSGGFGFIFLDYHANCANALAIEGVDADCVV